MPLSLHNRPGQASTDGDSVISSIPEIVAELHAGRMVILVDEEDRENEGDLLMAAEHVTPEAINFMVTQARGLVCLTLTQARCRQLGLKPMVSENGNSSQYGTNFTISIEAATGVTTGISAPDRARTIRAAIARDATPADIHQPGHIFPVAARDGGVLMRAGHTEAGCDLTAMAGCEPAAVICEVLKEDGEMARMPDLIEFGRKHGLKIGTIADLIHFRAHHEKLVERRGDRMTRTPWGELRLVTYYDTAYGRAHLALVHGDIETADEVLVRVHEPVSVFDFIDIRNSDKSWSLPAAIKAIQAAAAGVVVLINVGETCQHVLDQFDRLGAIEAGIVEASSTQKPMDLRTYGIGAQLLKDLGISKMRLLGNPRRMPSMVSGFGLEITGYLSGAASL
jgi:3,4-dihydroxy 2-butanone 4-phosphate synthase/GTP cyclohydrolase II